MKYSNAPEVEGVNARDGKGEAREFLLLASIFLVLVVVGSLTFLRVGALLGPLVPFSWEQRATPNFAFAQLGGGDPGTQQRLQALAQEISAALDMPADMPVTLHYVDGPTPNAFATFGGHIIVFRGLLDQLGTEEAIAALLAHEIAHVKHRHVIKGATGSVMLGVMWAALGFGSDMAAQIGNVGQVAQLPILSRTRAMEREADREAVAALVALYGHAGGYFALFDVLGPLVQAAEAPNLLRSHPKVADRVAQARQALPAAQQSGPMTPWP